MAVLLTALGCFIGGLIAGWVTSSSVSAWSTGRIMDRQQREIEALRHRLTEAEHRRREAERAGRSSPAL
ncbi:hypothetical protein [Nocardiopsis coralliicola]